MNQDFLLGMGLGAALTLFIILIIYIIVTEVKETRKASREALERKQQEYVQMIMEALQGGER